MTLATWLLQHPGVQIITRDRAGSYARGALAGAPQAIQVADRFHLLQNVREALVRAVDRHSGCLREAARAIVACLERGPPHASPPSDVDQPPPATRGGQRQEARRTKRLEQYRQVKTLHAKGLSLRALAKSLGLSRRTVRRYLRANGFPERAARFCPSRVDPFTEHLRKRWDEGCRNARELAGELQALGFEGSYDAVRRHVARIYKQGPT
jgi:transposase